MDNKTLIIPLLGMIYKVYMPEEKVKELDIGTIMASAKANIPIKTKETYLRYTTGTINEEFKMNIDYMIKHKGVHLPNDFRVIVTNGIGLTDQFIKRQIYIASYEIIRNENVLPQVIYAENNSF